jgi:antitoxin component YwqK of YwqJK toxin-antitoxin module
MKKIDLLIILLSGIFCSLGMAACHNQCENRVEAYFAGTNQLDYSYCSDEYGQPNGESLEYYQNGIIKQRANYYHGVLEGEFVKNYQNGELFVRATYSGGKLMEIHEYLDGNGRSLQTFEFRDGCGKVVQYNMHGDIEGYGHLVDGFKSGYWYLNSSRGVVDSILYLPEGELSSSNVSTVYW